MKTQTNVSSTTSNAKTTALWGVLVNASFRTKDQKSEARKKIDVVLVGVVEGLQTLGVEPKWLCTVGLPGVDTLALVEAFLKANPDVNVERLQARHGVQAVCEGLSPEQVADLLPEEAKPMSIVETGKCRISKATYPTTELAVPHRNSLPDDITEEGLRALAVYHMYRGKNDGSLADALAWVRKRDASNAGNLRRDAWNAFRKELRPGVVGEHQGKKFLRCSCCKRIAELNTFHWPLLAVMEEMCPVRDRQTGKPVANGKYFTPAVEYALTHFSACADCAPRVIASKEMSMDYETMLKVVKPARERFEERRAAEVAKMARRNAQQQGRRGNTTMSASDEAKGEQLFRNVTGERGAFFVR